MIGARVPAAVFAVLVGLGLLGAPPAAAATTAPLATAATADGVQGPVVLIGTGGVRWDDVDADTPALFSLLSAGAIGTLAVRSVRSTTCPVDGWLAVSAGRRAGDAEPTADAEPTDDAQPTADAQPTDGGCRQPAAELTEPGGRGTVQRWDTFLREAGAASFEAHPGLLGSTLAAAGVPAAAIGPGAAIALADPAGRVSRAWPGVPQPPGSRADPSSLVTQVSAALGGGTRLLVADVGAVRDGAGPRAAQVQDVDTRIGLLLGGLPQDATVVVASVADSAGTEPRLQLLAARGPAPGGGSYAGALLGVASTRQDGLAQTTDLLPTLLTALDVERPAEVVGSPLRPVQRGNDVLDRRQRVLDLDQAALAMHAIVPWFFNLLVAAQIVLYGAATVALRRGRSAAGSAQRWRMLRLLRRTAVIFASVPAATFLANLLPWWRAGWPWLAVTGAVAGFVVPIAGLALLGPWRNRVLGPFGVVGGATAAVLAADVATGSHLMLSSLMGVQPVVAGRFYGLSNPGFALFATGCLLLAIALANALSDRQRAAVGTVVAVGLVATVIDGVPGLGSDFGGPPAIVPAFGVLALLVAGVRVTWRRAVLLAVLSVAVLAALSVLDWLRSPAERTHLGRFVQTLIDGRAWPVVQRKLMQNLKILVTSWLSALLPFAVAFVVLVLARPVSWGVRPLQLAYDRVPVLRHGLVAFAVLIGIGFALNDSGTTIPAVAATVAIPLLIAASVRALELDDDAQLQAAVARARRPSRGRR